MAFDSIMRRRLLKNVGRSTILRACVVFLTITMLLVMITSYIVSIQWIVTAQDGVKVEIGNGMLYAMKDVSVIPAGIRIRKLHGIHQASWFPRWRYASLNQWELHLPVWILFVACGGSCFVIVGSQPMHRRAQKSICYHCGYNLIGLASSGRCPECGRSIQPSQGNLSS